MNTASCIVKSAQINDIDDLIRLRAYLLDQVSSASYASKTEEDRNIWRKQYRYWLYNVLEHSDNVEIVISVNDNHIIGCATGIVDCRAPARDCLSGHSGWIQSVVVEHSFRRRGIAASLLQSLTEWFRSKEVSKIVLESTPGSEKFYREQGFLPEKEALFTREI